MFPDSVCRIATFAAYTVRSATQPCVSFRTSCVLQYDIHGWFASAWSLRRTIYLFHSQRVDPLEWRSISASTGPPGASIHGYIYAYMHA